jgi:hypothetical protein
MDESSHGTPPNERPASAGCVPRPHHHISRGRLVRAKAPAGSMRWNNPPGWPSVPEGWSPPSGWEPDPAWPPAPYGWPLWTAEASESPAGAREQRTGHLRVRIASAGSWAVTNWRSLALYRKASAALLGIGVIAAIIVSLSLGLSGNGSRDSTGTGAGTDSCGSTVQCGVTPTQSQPSFADAAGYQIGFDHGLAVGRRAANVPNWDPTPYCSTHGPTAEAQGEATYVGWRDGCIQGAGGG